MIRRLSRLLDPLRGSGQYAITVPPMDGALQPNEALDEASLVCRLRAPDCLIEHGDILLAVSGARLMRVQADPQPVAEFDAEIVCGSISPAGALALGLANGRIVFRNVDPSGSVGPASWRDLETLGAERLSCPTALAWTSETTLVVCCGSQRNGPLEWKRDLTERGSSGSVWSVNADGGGARRLTEGLAFPSGVLVQPDGNLVVSEGWRSRLVRIAANGRVTSVLSDLPGYPAGLSARRTGGAWLALFAPRSQMFEFILREGTLREDMIRDIEPDYWMAPSLRPARSFLEPLQGGALKQLGMMKPWAPSRAYGLVLALDADFRPEASAHSRADGSRHGVRSIIERDGALLVASKGGDAIVALPLDAHGAFA